MLTWHCEAEHGARAHLEAVGADLAVCWGLLSVQPLRAQRARGTRVVPHGAADMLLVNALTMSEASGQLPQPPGVADGVASMCRGELSGVAALRLQVCTSGGQSIRSVRSSVSAHAHAVPAPCRQHSGHHPGLAEA